MTLYDYLILTLENAEVTVWDKDYNIEIYFYNDQDEDNRWQISMLELAKLLTVTKIWKTGIEVDLSDLINRNINNLKESELFNHCDIDSVMNDIEYIISGNVSEEWIETFVNILKGDYDINKKSNK